MRRNEKQYENNSLIKITLYCYVVLIIIVIFVIGGIIYKMGQTNNDSRKIAEGAAEGGCLLMSLIQYFAIPIIAIGFIVFLIRSCN